MELTFFPTFADFYAWMEVHHTEEKELWVGFYKKASGIPSITWPESVDVGLCFGWIDGLRKSIDNVSYKIRFTPRKPKSHWSAVNLKRVPELITLDLMHPAGIAAYERRDPANTLQAAYEQKNLELPPAYLAKIQANELAWEYFQNMAPGYKKNTVWWVIKAKREETRLRRLRILIESCEEGKKVPPFRSKK